MEDTLFHNLLREINAYGCVLIIGNGTAFVIPESQYLQVTKNQSLYKGQHSNQFNIALPADYTSFNFNDHGENTIKGVYAIQDGTGDVCSYPKAATGIINGCYIDPNPNVFGNIVLKTLPSLASSYIAYSAAFGGQCNNGIRCLSARVMVPSWFRGFLGSVRAARRNFSLQHNPSHQSLLRALAHCGWAGKGLAADLHRIPVVW